MKSVFVKILKGVSRMKIGDRYTFPTSEGFETFFEGDIIEVRDKAICFESRQYICKNHGHHDCMVSDVIWLPKSIVKKHGYYDEPFELSRVDVPFWMNVSPRIKHYNRFTQGGK
jgi:hypothetical protein